MNTFTIKIEAPELVAALQSFISLIQTDNRGQAPAPTTPPPSIPPTAPAANYAPSAPPSTPALPPTAPPPAYTVDQIQRAAVAVADAGKRPQVLELLAKYGVQMLTDLPEARYGEFAAALRELGAAI